MSFTIVLKKKLSSCIQLEGNNIDNGTKVQLGKYVETDHEAYCNQEWLYDNGLIKLAKNPNYCIHLVNGDTGNGMALHLSDVLPDTHESYENQIWLFENCQIIPFRARSKCLTLGGGETGDGTTINICDIANEADPQLIDQEWVFKPATKFHTKLYIDGQFVSPVQGGTFPLFNPATGEVFAQCGNATAEDVDLAVKAARRCLEGPSWGYASTGAQRAVILRKLGQIITARKAEIAQLDCWDMGKPMREALADIGDAEVACEHFAMLAEKQDAAQWEGVEVPPGMEDFTTKIVHEPVGVVGAITPWNYPFLMGIWKVVPALAAGCCIVLKPSELAPLSCLLLAEMCEQAGLPSGALNVIPGLGPDAGGPLTKHPGIDKLAFTGSTNTGRRVMTAAAESLCSVSMELGGKSPLLVFDDAAVDAAVDWILTGIIWGSGQVCSATARVLVQRGVRAELTAKLVARMGLLRLGPALPVERDGTYSGHKMGPVVSKNQYDKVWAFIDEAKSEGLTFTVGGAERPTGKELSGGYFVPPVLIEDPPLTARVWREEIFGPVMCIREFLTEEEALAEANNSEYGLAAAVFSSDSDRCLRLSRALRAGIVWANCSQPAFVTAPWGGIKKSGFGRELGKWGLEEFSVVKQVTSCAPGHQWALF